MFADLRPVEYNDDGLSALPLTSSLQALTAEVEINNSSSQMITICAWVRLMAVNITSAILQASDNTAMFETTLIGKFNTNIDIDRIHKVLRTWFLNT